MKKQADLVKKMRNAINTTLALLFFILVAVPISLAGDIYKKLDSQGRDLADEAATWAMVKDNATGLIWEVKTSDGSIHDKDRTFKWKKVKKEFLKVLNDEKFGGFDDWRLPLDEELNVIVDKEAGMPMINTVYFPNTEAVPFWALYICGDGTHYNERVNFGDGPLGKKSAGYRVRAVRGERKK